MGYQLGIDLGVSETTVAAIEAGWPAVVPISGSAPVPTILHIGTDGTARGGRTAARLARRDPDRHAARFVERLGEPAPILVGGVGYSASSLVARYLSWLVDTVTRMRGEAPELVVVTAPGSWPDRRREGLADALARVEADVAITARPSADALGALLTRSGRAAPGRYVATFDLGSDWFEAAVHTAMPSGFVVAGSPVGLSDVTTAMLDELLRAHVVAALPADTPAAVLSASAPLLAACAAAREDLVDDETATIEVATGEAGEGTGTGGTGGNSISVTVSREEYENLVRPMIEDAARALARAIRSVPATPEDVSLLVLRGPGARLPLVSKVLGESLGGIGRRETHPDSDLALGAALLAAAANPTEPASSQTVVLGPAAYTTTPPPSIPPASRPPTVSSPAVSSPADVPPGAVLTGVETQAVEPVEPVEPAPPVTTRRARHSSARKITAAAAALAVFVAGSVTLGLVLADDDGDSAAITAADTGPLPPSTIDQHPQFPADMMRSAEKAAGITAGNAAPATTAPDGPETVIATGSAEVAPITGTAYAMFREAQKGVAVRVSATDTDDGFARLCAGDADIAGASFALTDPACKDKVVGFEIAHHLLPIVVPKTNTWVKCLTTAQIGAMWKRDSTVTSWNQIDPSFPAEPVRLVGPAPGTVHAKVFLASMTGASDNTRKYREVELDEVPEEVEYDRGAIGFMDYSNFQTAGGDVRAIQLDAGRGCVEPNALTAGTGMYMPLCKPLYVYASKESLRRPAVAAFMNYYMENQKDVTFRAHFVARDDATIRDNTAIVHAMTSGVEPVRT